MPHSRTATTDNGEASPPQTEHLFAYIRLQAKREGIARAIDGAASGIEVDTGPGRDTPTNRWR